MKNSPLCIEYNGKDTPHGIIEVNQQCNISCKACYKNRSHVTKPLSQIHNEFKLLLKLRNLDQVTIAGGEPTLHPDIVEIIRYFKQCVPHINMLSNGYKYDSKLLTEMKNAGLSCIHVHIDEMQIRRDIPEEKGIKNFNKLRDFVAGQLHEANIVSALSITLYKSNVNKVKDIVDYFYKSTISHSFLITLCTDFKNIGNRFLQKTTTPHPGLERNSLLSTYENTKKPTNNEEVKIRDIEKALFRSYSLNPDYYLGSNKNRAKKKWIFYNTFTFVDSSGTIHLLQGSRNFNKLFLLFDKLSYLFRGIRLFDIHVDQNRTINLLRMSMMVSFSPLYIKKAHAFKKNLKLENSGLFYKKLYVQEGPEISETGDIEYCKSCPDATIRNGKLIPVCLADVLTNSEFQL